MAEEEGVVFRKYDDFGLAVLVLKIRKMVRGRKKTN